MISKIIKRIVLPSLVVAVLIMDFTGCVEATENMENILEDHITSVGNECEDTLVMDFSERYDGEVFVYDSDELTLDTLENRNGKVIVERCYSVVTDAHNGIGKVLNVSDKNFNYISYSRCEGIREGTLMLTYLVYNPDTNYCDDIVERYDCVVSHELED